MFPTITSSSTVQPNRMISFGAQVSSLDHHNRGQHLASCAQWNLRLEPNDISEVGGKLLDRVP